jgi:hypothetical protein
MLSEGKPEAINQTDLAVQTPTYNVEVEGATYPSYVPG